MIFHKYLYVNYNKLCFTNLFSSETTGFMIGKYLNNNSVASSFEIFNFLILKIKLISIL